MSKNTARKYSSSLAKQLLAELTPTEKSKARTRMLLAVRIEEMITAKGWSKSVFASKVGKSPSVISKWLSGTHNFEVDTLDEIAMALDKPLEALFAEKAVQVIYKTEVVVAIAAAPPSIRYATPRGQVSASKCITSWGTYRFMSSSKGSFEQA